MSFIAYTTMLASMLSTACLSHAEISFLHEGRWQKHDKLFQFLNLPLLRFVFNIKRGHQASHKWTSLFIFFLFFHELFHMYLKLSILLFQLLELIIQCLLLMRLNWWWFVHVDADVGVWGRMGLVAWLLWTLHLKELATFFTASMERCFLIFRRSNVFDWIDRLYLIIKHFVLIFIFFISRLALRAWLLNDLHFVHCSFIIGLQSRLLVLNLCLVVLILSKYALITLSLPQTQLTHIYLQVLLFTMSPWRDWMLRYLTIDSLYTWIRVWINHVPSRSNWV